MSNNNNKEDDLSDVLNIFKDAIDSPIDTQTNQPQEASSQSSILNKRKQDVISVNRNTTLDRYPSEMSCVTAFDEVFSCYSVGGQLRNYYRYGELNSCAAAYEKFLFCVGNTFSRKSDEEKKVEVQKFYKKQFLLTKAKGSSEDIWDIRK